MKALVLAAGLGTRLKPITDSIPKALVKVGGEPMIQRIILRLKDHGFNYIVVNTHHFSDKIKDFLSRHDFGIEIEVSDESQELLDTGGGIVKAKELLFKYDEDPFLVHNVDILSNADISEIVGYNKKEYSSGGVLLVNDRDSSRKLLFDDEMQLKGWHDLKADKYRPNVFDSVHNYKEVAFSGIYSLSLEMVEEMERLMGKGKFAVMEYFLHPERQLPLRGLFRKGIKIIDIGKPATLMQASGILND